MPHQPIIKNVTSDKLFKPLSLPFLKLLACVTEDSMSELTGMVCREDKIT